MQNTEENIKLTDSDNDQRKVIDLGMIASRLWEKRKVFFKIWPVVFVLSCIWIFPEPRFYTCDVSLAPEASDASLSGGGLSSIASSFGINIGSMNNQDAIYPMLYPDLFESPEFVVSLFDINVKSDDGEVDTDYYTYLKTHTKKNALKKPFNDAIRWVKSLFVTKKGSAAGEPSKVNPFRMSEDDYSIYTHVKDNVQCAHDKKTDVISITVVDQDPLVCATLADSVMHRLQDFIVMYRTSKARLDVDYYQHLVDSTRVEYEQSAAKYGRYCDSHKDPFLQGVILQREELEADMSIKLNTYTAMQTQLQAMKAKVQERTPAFTTLKSATVPIKPAGPKRMIFVAAMLFLATIATSVWLLRDEFLK